MAYGFNSIVQNFGPFNAGFASSPLIIPARVLDIILDDQHPEFVKQGAWDSIGTIQFKPVYSTTLESIQNAFLYARPFFSNIKHYPLKNEIVFIMFLPNQNTQSNSDGTYYYIDTINIWNSVHHNALPNNPDLEISPQEQKQDYIPTSAGVSRRVTDNSTEIKLGTTFKERLNIHPLLPYEGDTIIEGRWGQSLRFGSTVTNSKIRNLWSSTGTNGDPLILIRNNQSVQTPEEGWIPVLENINLDGSSIYLTSYQNIPIKVSSTNTDSFNKIFEIASIDNIILEDIQPAPTGSPITTDANLITYVDPSASIVVVPDKKAEIKDEPYIDNTPKDYDDIKDIDLWVYLAWQQGPLGSAIHYTLYKGTDKYPGGYYNTKHRNGKRVISPQAIYLNWPGYNLVSVARRSKEGVTVTDIIKGTENVTVDKNTLYRPPFNTEENIGDLYKNNPKKLARGWVDVQRQMYYSRYKSSIKLIDTNGKERSGVPYSEIKAAFKRHASGDITYERLVAFAAVENSLNLDTEEDEAYQTMFQMNVTLFKDTLEKLTKVESIYVPRNRDGSVRKKSNGEPYVYYQWGSVDRLVELAVPIMQNAFNNFKNYAGGFPL